MTRSQAWRRGACRRVLAAIVGVFIILAAPTARLKPLPHAGGAPPPPFGAWLTAVVEEAVARGYDRHFLEQTLSGLQPLPRVMRADRRQAEVTQTLDEYLTARVTPELVTEGQRLMNRHRLLLARIERAYGVEGRFVVAIWGAETGYGRYTGDVPVVDALATLAWEPRRSRYFRGELFAALRMLADERIERQQMVGSWAGAVGQPQFMPSSYLRYAVDFDGDGHRDLWHSVDDTLASIAHYLQTFGWQRGEAWGGEVAVTPALRSRLQQIVASRQRGCAALRGLSERRPFAEWRGVGIRPLNGTRRGSQPGASLLALDGRVFLVGPNYEAILGYNCAHRYALSVSLLADAMQDRGGREPRLQRRGRVGTVDR